MNKKCFIIPSIAILISSLVLAFTGNVKESMKNAATAGIFVANQSEDKAVQQWLASDHHMQGETSQQELLAQAGSTASALNLGSKELAEDISGSLEKIKKLIPGVQVKVDASIHDWYVYLFYKTLTLVPKKHLGNLQKLQFVNDKKNKLRGFTISSKKSGRLAVDLTLNHPPFPFETGFKCRKVSECLAVTKEKTNMKALGVMIHEFGHIMDLGGSTDGKSGSSPFRDGGIKIPGDDPSVKFYEICWSKEDQLSNACTRKVFGSDYGKTWCFEDFAELFVIYILDGYTFFQNATDLAKKGDKNLMKKYEVIKSMMDGKEFRDIKTKMAQSWNNYDATSRNYTETFLELLF